MKPYGRLISIITIISLFTGLSFAWPCALLAQAQQQTPLPEGSSLERILESGTLIAGVKYDAPPFGYRTEDGMLVGFEIDLVRAMAERWLGDDDAVEFVQVTSSDRIPRLLNGDIDLIIATMTITDERDEQIDFSQVYFLDGQNILVRADEGFDMIEDLDGKRVAAVQGSTSIEQVVSYAQSNNVNLEIIQYEKYTEAVRPLLDGDIDGLTTDQGILSGIASTNPELTILLDENFSEEPYGVGVPQGDSELLALVNDMLDELRADGTYNRIYAQWFAEPGARSPTPRAATVTTTTVPDTATPPPGSTSGPTLTSTPTLLPSATPSPLPTGTATAIPTDAPTQRSATAIVNTTAITVTSALTSTTAMSTTAMNTTAMNTTAMNTTAMNTTAMNTTAMNTTAMNTTAMSIAETSTETPMATDAPTAAADASNALPDRLPVTGGTFGHAHSILWVLTVLLGLWIFTRVEAHWR